MILKFLKQLFCFPHHYEQELSPFDDDSFKLSGITISRSKGENEWVG